MELIRKGFDGFYDLIKHPVFWATQSNPEIAHEMFSRFCNFLSKTKIDKYVLDFPRNKTVIPISNAAGFNKNADISPETLGYLGFDRVVVGTVTADAWKGNDDRPRIVRYPQTESMVNWMGLPGIGANKVYDKLITQSTDVPLTINIMSTPGKNGDDKIKDLEYSILSFRDLNFVDRFELNISCPNTASCSGGLDVRAEHKNDLEAMLSIREGLYPNQKFYVKVSPDIDYEEVCQLIELGEKFGVNGYVTTNTTTYHDSEFIPESPGKGGASGNAVYEKSLEVQKMFDRKREESGLDFKIIACGGINSLERLEERRELCAEEVQIYTPLIFRGPRVLRELRG